MAKHKIHNEMDAKLSKFQISGVKLCSGIERGKGWCKAQAQARMPGDLTETLRVAIQSIADQIDEEIKVLANFGGDKEMEVIMIYPRAEK